MKDTNDRNSLIIKGISNLCAPLVRGSTKTGTHIVARRPTHRKGRQSFAVLDNRAGITQCHSGSCVLLDVAVQLGQLLLRFRRKDNRVTFWS